MIFNACGHAQNGQPTMSQEALKTALQETCAQRDTFKEHAEALTQEVLRLREQLG